MSSLSTSIAERPHKFTSESGNEAITKRFHGSEDAEDDIVSRWTAEVKPRTR
jgi:hypothetical protein